MKKLHSLRIGLLLTVLTAGNSFAASSPSELLQQGLYAEEVEGNMTSAIKAYQQVIQNDSAAHAEVAQALYREGMCYLKLKDESAAKTALEKLVKDYADQSAIVNKARLTLDDLTDFDPASLMPPETVAYLELGSPGAQIETILTMLKGTPFENPLAAIGGQPSHRGNQKSPADIMGALLNPSMIAEFKKIRSSAIGLTGMAQNHPPMVAVLYPGDSDALRGLIQGTLGMAGVPGQTMEGMQTVKLPEDMEAAFDNRIVIVTRPASRLEWCVKQYKGIISGPTLASSDRLFEKLSKSERKNNALTLWVNPGELYQQAVKIFPPGHIPRGLQVANQIEDFSNTESLVVTAAVKPDGLVIKADQSFKDGHRSLPYDLIRTPNIRKVVLRTVPTNAIALASLSLSQADTNRADQVRVAARNVTGLDVGREVFANIEQLTVFALPRVGSANDATAKSFLPDCLGVAITSHDPEKTRQLLTTLLSTANLMSGGQIKTNEDCYRIGNNGRQSLYCYMKQVDGITFLSLNRAVVDDAVATINQHQSVCDSGPLNRPLNQLTPTTSKLVVVNAGGAIRLLVPQMKSGSLNNEQRKQFDESVEQLAKAADQATIELRTDEQQNELALNINLAGIPQLNQVLGPINQIQTILHQARAEAVAKQARASRPAVIYPAASEPAVDGQVDKVWHTAEAYQLENVLRSLKGSKHHLAANYRALWNHENLYLLIDVADDTPHHNPEASWHDNDGIELYLDATDSKSAQYGPTDYQYCLNWDKTSPQMNELKHGKTNGVIYALVTTDKGYRVEVKLPWATLGVSPKTGARLGLDVQVNDNQDGNKRDAKIAWHDQQDNAWHSPQAFGHAELGGLIGWWKFDDAEGKTAKDSSGENHDGTLVGNAQWGTGKVGGALDLDGKGSYVRIADKSAFNLGNEITMAAWVNFRSKPVAWAAIVGKGDSAWRLSANDADTKFRVSIGTGSGDSVYGSTKVNTGEWHHVTGVYSDGILRLYVDGKLERNQLRTGKMKKNHFEVLIGENDEKKGRFFDGLLDDVRIYNYALPEDQIKALAATGAGSND